MTRSMLLCLAFLLGSSWEPVAASGGAGACCVGPDSCAFVANQSFCESIGGIWLGSGSDCSGSPCANVAACCLGDGTCTLTFGSSACAGLGGEWQAGSDCDDVSCAGGCCVAPFSCMFVAGREFCDAAGGAWLGADSDCFGASCLVGACCLGDGSCVLTFGSNSCNALGGDFQGSGVDCAASTCDGACCFSNGACEQTDVADCDDIGGDWQGVGSGCGACDGACCFADLTCEASSASLECQLMGGAWQGATTDCADITCPGGACCVGAGCQPVTELIQCFALGGDEFFPGLLCSEVECGGACCLFDGSCIVTGEIGCLGQGGAYAPGESCVQACGGGCCLGDAGCQNRTEAECDELGGCFAGVGAYCNEIVCDGFTTAFASDAPVFIDGGAGSMAESTIDVPAAGAQVLDVNVALHVIHSRVGELCVELSHGGTTVTLVARQGAAALCEASPDGCDGVAWDIVLDDDGTGGPIEDQCVPQLVSPPAYVPEHALAAFRGASAGGPWTLKITDWQNGNEGVLLSWSIEVTTCTAILEACCFVDGSCADVTASSCFGSGGVIQGDGSVCATTSCPVTGGACCLGDDGCLPRTEADCDDLGGCYGGFGTTCATVACPAFVTVLSDDPNVPIPDGTAVPAESTVTVPGSRTVVDVDLDVEIDHTYVGDLCVTLSHGGQMVTVIQRPGNSSLECNDSDFTGTCDQNDYDITLDDAGAGGPIAFLCNASMVSPPGYEPQNPLAAFRGADAAGDWTLSVSDAAGFDVGTFISWSLVLTTCTPLCPGDIDGDGMVGLPDLLAVLSTWGPCGGPCPEDIDGDGIVGFEDLVTLLSAWGPC